MSYFKRLLRGLSYLLGFLWGLWLILSACVFSGLGLEICGQCLRWKKAQECYAFENMVLCRECYHRELYRK